MIKFFFLTLVVTSLLLADAGKPYCSGPLYGSPDLNACDSAFDALSNSLPGVIVGDPFELLAPGASQEHAQYPAVRTPITKVDGVCFGSLSMSSIVA